MSVFARRFSIFSVCFVCVIVHLVFPSRVCRLHNRAERDTATVSQSPLHPKHPVSTWASWIWSGLKTMWHVGGVSPDQQPYRTKLFHGKTMRLVYKKWTLETNSLKTYNPGKESKTIFPTFLTDKNGRLITKVKCLACVCDKSVLFIPVAPWFCAVPSSKPSIFAWAKSSELCQEEAVALSPGNHYFSDWTSLAAGRKSSAFSFFWFVGYHVGKNVTYSSIKILPAGLGRGFYG